MSGSSGGKVYKAERRAWPKIREGENDPPVQRTKYRSLRPEKGYPFLWEYP